MDPTTQAEAPTLGALHTTSSAAPPRTPELVALFLRDRRARGLSPRSIESYAAHFKRLLAWIGEWPLERETVRRYLLFLAEQPLSPASIYVAYRALHALGNLAADEGLLPANPARRLSPAYPKRRPPSYSVVQIQKLLKVCGVRDRAIVLCLLDTGLRAGELLSLRRDRIDFDTGQFTVIGKGQKERSGWFHPYVLGEISCYLATRKDDDPALWVGRTGVPLTRNGLYQALRRLAVAAGIRGDCRRIIHSFRATFARSYLLQGGSVEELRLLLGHETVQMALHYATLSDEVTLAARKRKVNPLGAILPLGGMV